MARSPRLFIPGAVYHVYCRTARGEVVFSDPTEASAFVDILADVKRLHGFLVLAWCLMGNHYHLVIRTQDTPLWRSMARIQGRIARGHNRRRHLLGRLWQSRYKARMVPDEAYLRQVVAYVHLNPVAASLVLDPAVYRWSGHAELLGRRFPRLVDTAEALRGFGLTRAAARQAYLGQVRAVAEARWLGSGVRALPWWHDVANNDLLMPPENAHGAVDYRGDTVERVLNSAIDLDRAAVAVCIAAGIDTGTLRGRSRLPGVAVARQTFANLAVDCLGHTVADVAAFLGKHPGSVSRWLATPLDRHRMIDLQKRIIEGSNSEADTPTLSASL